VIRLALRVDVAHAEVLLAELLELAPGGVEERALEGQVEYALYGAPGELPALPELQALVDGVLVDVSTSEVGDDWHERWREFHRPLRLDSPGAGARDLYVRPPWERAAGPGAVDLVIDPAQAFGTGAHATTRMSLELLLALAAADPRRGAVLDIGTGSGVLAIAAGRLGYGPLVAIDNDTEALRAAAENALVNGVQLDVRRCDLRREQLPWPDPAGDALVLANLLRPLLLELAGRLDAPPASLIVSGLLEEELDELAASFAAAGISERERRTGEGWGALLLRR